MMIWIALAPFIAGLLEIVLFLVLVHATVPRYRSLAVAASLGLVAGGTSFAVGASGTASHDWIGYLCLVLGSFIGITFCFWAMINLSQTALRVRVLREIWQAPGRALSVEALSRRYAGEEIIDRRLSRLVQLGHISIDENGRVRLLKPTIARISDILTWIRRLVIPQNRP